jgi:outer membrane receptor for ferrienterochelin and colicins
MRAEQTSRLNMTVSLILFLVISLSTSNVIAEPNTPGNLFDMSLEQLMNIPVTSTSLTAVSSGRVSPSTVTTITQQDIQNSGARSLNELLEIYVPNLQMILHSAGISHLGLRGIISNRDDKYLLLVNGRVMNEHTDLGVLSERDLPMLRDIHQIDVVRGPGSAMYGPGALAMVINIITDNANTFKGFEVSQRVGVIEEHYTTEFKYGHQLKDGAGLFLYGGISEYPGASAHYSPLIYGGGPTLRRGKTYAWDQEVTTDIRRYGDGYDNLPRIKLHGEYTKNNLDIWLRYTQGGYCVDTTGDGYINNLFEEGYRQATAVLNYKQELADNFALKYMFSYERFEAFTNTATLRFAPAHSYNRPRNYGEDEYYGQIIANWKVNENQEFAFGGAWRYDEFGLKAWGQDTAIMYRFPGAPVLNVMPRWHTNMGSMFGEYQWRINNQLTAFVSARQDDHTFTERMFSPRFSLVYTPTDVDTLKLIASRSVRTNNDAEMKKAEMGGLYSNSDVEILKAYEARYERRVSDHIWLAADAFIHNQDMIGWVSTPSPGFTGPLGTEKLWGVEVEASYVQNRFRFDVSHGFTKLLDFKLPPGVTAVPQDTAEPGGYGHDLADWYNNISKVRVHYQVDDKLSLDSSLIVYWDNPGGEDYAKMRRIASASNYDPRSRDVFYNNWYLNLGLQYQYSKNLTLRMDAYDILGLFDQDLNKRNVGFNTERPAEVRIQPASLGFQLIYKF